MTNGTMDVRDMSDEELDAYNASMNPAMKAMLGQLLICLVNRSKGEVRVPIAEVDGTGRFILTMEVDQGTREFIFRTEEKQ